MKKLSRRTFAKLGWGSVLALASSGIGTVCAKNDSSSGPGSVPKINASVGAVKGDSLDSMTRDAIEAVGGMGSVVNEGETVFIKPNMVNPYGAGTGDSTKPELLIATAEECLKAGASEVIIGDGGQYPVFPWEHLIYLDGSTNIISEVEKLNANYTGSVRLSCLENDFLSNLEIDSVSHGKLFISSIYNSIDKIISIPVAKTHRWGQLTLGLKNFFGVISHDYSTKITLPNGWEYWDRGTGNTGIDHSSAAVIADTMLDIVSYKKPDLTIIDFSICVEGDGPDSETGKTLDVKTRLGSYLVLASKDIMAADATAARIMSHNVADIIQLTKGYDLGLGEIHEENIELTGERLSDLIMPWQPAKGVVPVELPRG